MVPLKTFEEISEIAEAGKILSRVMAQITMEAKIGASLKFLDKLAETLIRKACGEPAFLNYKPDGAKNPYGASICASLNEVIVHGFPNERKLESGDVLKLDFGVFYKGFYADAATTILIGRVSGTARLLVQATAKALEQALKKCKAGKTLGDIGFEIERTAKKFGFKVVKGLTGHGIGRELHEEPTIYNFGEKRKGLKLEPGMVLAIEPMLTAGSDEIIQLADESWATKDGSLSAHFEHTVAITKEGYLVLTN